ncbi:LuxR C-terminal-related transcriptional regulator [Nocardia vermiculata]|uniref:LuxR family transcriptional regulator n=1 Tax=Nocardia vermiculata TaxID=257274 RepID=A0A846XRN2_9NOCA|nr:LuxR C-terminal-related transcriptional regulator [Nocardia vermiculata]NKY49257.1 LuxR family transcriptional regulator [Nocardia vermiculata]
MARRVTGNLPAEVTSFVGRREELATAKRMLPATRVLTLLGPGGVGKTRLSQQVGAAAARAFPDGVWFVELAEVHEPDLVTLGVAEALQLRDDTSEPQQRLTEFLADKRLLLILDNCEHLIGACADLVAHLVSATSELTVLATSREVLGVPGEQVMPVAPLPAADEDSDALQLLVERARAANPAFTPTPANRPVLAAICHRLDGIPLALELAALRFRMFTPEQIRDRLDDTLGLLSAGPRTAPQRQQTIEGAIRWSHELCTPAEQALWHQLSVFTGGFDLEAAEAVCIVPPGPQSLLDALSGLVDKSVVRLRYDESTPRYSMLEPIRQFGHARLAEAGEEVGMRTRHRDHYGAIALRGLRAYASAEDLPWFRQLDREHANLRSALQFSMVEAPHSALVTATVLRPFWEHYRFLSEGYRWLTDALARSTEPTWERARALASASSLAALLSDRESAVRLHEECVDTATALGAGELLIEAELGAALIAFTESDTERALDRAERAAAMAREHRHAGAEMDSLAFGFMCATLLGVDRASDIARDFHALTQRRGPHMLGGLALWMLGIDSWRNDDQDSAEDYFGRAIEEFALFDRCVWLASGFDGMAWSAAVRGETDRAAWLMGAAETLQRNTMRLADSMSSAIGAQVRESVRKQLGDRAFREALEVGAAMTLPAAIDYALGRTAATGPAATGATAATRPATAAASATSTASRSPTSADPTALALLTRRERDVARLVAAGHSNKRIASELVISVRTAETHVEHILTKLGFTSRTQVAGWARDHGL